MIGMHEAAIVRRIIAIAEAEAGQVAAARIGLIKLRVGEFRGVAREALEFAFGVLKGGTMAAGARLEVETIPLRIACPGCGEFRVKMEDLRLSCPGCGGPAIIISGRELEVEYLEFEEEPLIVNGEGERCTGS